MIGPLIDMWVASGLLIPFNIAAGAFAVYMWADEIVDAVRARAWLLTATLVAAMIAAGWTTVAYVGAFLGWIDIPRLGAVYLRPIQWALLLAGPSAVRMAVHLGEQRAEKRILQALAARGVYLTDDDRGRAGPAYRPDKGHDREGTPT